MLKVYVADCVERMAAMDEASVDAIVCDPPYGLEFMGKDWDNLDLRQPFRGEVQTPENPYGRSPVRYATGASYGARVEHLHAQQAWHARWLAEALRVLKPGGHLVAFGGTRTFHRLVSAAEDVGFEIRDVLSWHYGQGFPKSRAVWMDLEKRAGGTPEVVSSLRTNVGMQGGNFTNGSRTADVNVLAPTTEIGATWFGYGTALKPAWEPIVLARKPPVGTLAENIEAHGAGLLNIDACRIETAPGDEVSNHGRGETSAKSKGTYGDSAPQQPGQSAGQALGRYPANVMLSHGPGCEYQGITQVKRRLLDAREARAQNNGVLGPQLQGSRSLGSTTEAQEVWKCAPGCPVAELDRQSNDASRFFYTSKANNGERWGYCHDCETVINRKAHGKAHKGHKLEWHPTVKPLDAMTWLVRLVGGQPGSVVLDPFMGTGTTGEAALRSGFQFIGIERERTYAKISARRLKAVRDELDGEVE